jgi:Uma2 family endonuclease
MTWLSPSRLRGPDVAFTSWQRFPGRRLPKTAYPRIALDLAIEVLSTSNTKKEMLFKRRDYFRAGTSAVWEVNPRTRTVSVFSSSEEPDAVLHEVDTLDGGALLPGFKVRLTMVFAELDSHG